MWALSQEGTGDKVESSKKRSVATRNSNTSSADPRRIPDSGGASTSGRTAFSLDLGSPQYDGGLFCLEEEAARLNPSTLYSESPHQQETEIAEAADSDSYSLPDDSELQRKLLFGKCFLFEDCI
ncbi:hypothetical protein EWM64_g4469 [Hericium alpestre]|uniref:Uncharacterized protein n=1 Tax=Hericium alpestre TaxID=135208 RepID=A0A4Y9ZZR8_9AGAM|nr:hypothetical protein EWM64_g4469 [Hericium alpestre]